MKKIMFALALFNTFSSQAIATSVQTIKVIDDLKKVETPVKTEFVKTKLVLFKVNKSELTPHSKKQLKSIATKYLEHKQKQPLLVTVVGHTDKTGSLEYNLELSKDRAVSAANYLIDNGVDVEDLTINFVAYQNPASGERNSLIERSTEVTLKTL